MDSSAIPTTTNYSVYHAENRHGVTFSREWDVFNSIQQIKKVMHLHYYESSAFKESEILSPDWKKYSMLADQDMLRLFSIKDNTDNKWVGYYLAWLSSHYHYKEVIVAYSDLIFILRKHRGWLGLKFLNWVDLCLKEDGAKYNIWACNPEFDFAPLAKRKKYKPLNIQYIKEL